jgi:hypothetical protein
MKLEFSRQFLEKYSNIKFHENPSGGNRTVPGGQTEGRMGGRNARYDKANSRFSQFCEHPKKKHGCL